MTGAPCIFCASPKAPQGFEIGFDPSIVPGHACLSCFDRAIDTLHAAPDGACAFCRADASRERYIVEHWIPDGACAHLCGTCRRALLTETETVRLRGGETS